MNRPNTRLVRRVAAVAAVTAVLAGGSVTQASPAAALWWIEFGPYASVDECNSVRTDLQPSGTTQPCRIRAGQWYFKFAQDF